MVARMGLLCSSTTVIRTSPVPADGFCPSILCCKAKFGGIDLALGRTVFFSAEIKVAGATKLSGLTAFKWFDWQPIQKKMPKKRVKGVCIAHWNLKVGILSNGKKGVSSSK